MQFSKFKTYVREGWQMLNFMSSHRKVPYFIGSILSSLLQALFAIVFGLAMRDLIAFTQTGDNTFLEKAVLMLGGQILLIVLLLPFVTYLYTRSVVLTIQEIREQLFMKISNLSTAYLENTHSGDLLSRVNNDVTVIEATFKEHYQSLTVQFFTVTGCLAAMFYLNWMFACFVLLIVLLVMYVNIRFTNSIREINNQIQGILGKTTGKFSEFVTGIHLIKMFHITHIYKQYQKYNQETAEYSNTLGKTKGKLEATNHFLSLFSFSGVLIAGLIFYYYGYMGLDVVIGFVMLQLYVTQIILETGDTVSRIQTSFAGAQRINELFDEEEEPSRMGERVQSPPSNEALELRNIDFSYDKKSSVLQNLSMKVPPEQVIAIVGASGSGKSTLMKLLLGFYPIEKGEILIQGQSFYQYSIDELRQLIAYVPQDAYLFTGSIEENIRHGNPHATMEEIEKATKAAYAHDFIMELPDGYQTILGERGVTLSGGQKQRIAIARALLKNASILLLDEATSALDNEAEYWVQKALNSLMQGRTTIVIAHRLSTIENADQIYVMDGGKIVEQGTHRELLNLNGIYTKLYEEQFQQEAI